MRTYSKIYGMAGIRAGFAFGRPDMLEKFQTISPEIRLRNVASVFAHLRRYGRGQPARSAASSNPAQNQH
jgi:histidinol-phosphate/aromatic aminotransferase/cobyric acid decarboxylase-like protein